MSLVLDAPAHSPLVLQQTRSLSRDMAALLDGVTWGTEGALYQVIRFDQTLEHIPDAEYVTLRHNHRLVAMEASWPKRVPCGSEELQAVYQSLLTVNPEEQGNGHGKTIARAALEQALPLLGRKGILYAYVEAGNRRSETIFRSLDFRTMGSFYTTAFSRLFPRDSDHIMPLDSADAPLMRRLLTSQYHPGHALIDFETSLQTDAYWVVTDSQGIAAGIQVYPQHWVIRSIGGFGGNVALNVLPHVPLIRGIFNPKDFRFLKMGNIYFRKGQEKTVFRLVEAVLARYRLKTAMAYFDLRSPVYQALARAGTFGILNPLTRTKVNVFAYPHHLSPTETSHLSQQPLVISPFDI